MGVGGAMEGGALQKEPHPGASRGASVGLACFDPDQPWIERFARHAHTAGSRTSVRRVTVLRQIRFNMATGRSVDLGRAEVAALAARVGKQGKGNE